MFHRFKRDFAKVQLILGPDSGTALTDLIAGGVTITDFGDLKFVVGQIVMPEIQIANAADKAEGDNPAPTSATFDGTVRDFRGLDTTTTSGLLSEHANFEDFAALQYRLGNPGVPVLNAVGPALVGGLPAFLGGTTFTNMADFDQWYTDVAGVNLSQPLSIDLDYQDNQYQFLELGSSSGEFFPIDGQLAGNTIGGLQGAGDHNYHLTYEAHGTFVSQPGQTLATNADDDLWIYVDDQLVLDRGGVNIAIANTLDLDSLGLTPGTEHTIDFFFAERHTINSVLQLFASSNLLFNVAAANLPMFATFVVSLDQATTADVTVDFTTVDGTATAGQDYLATSGTLTFEAGQTSKTILVPIHGNTADDSDRSFSVMLSNPGGGTLGAMSTGNVTITDDDAPAELPVVSIEATDADAAEEGQDPGVFTISRTGPTDADLTVTFGIIGTADLNTNTDYATIDQSVTIAQGQSSATVTVVPFDDDDPENDETVILTLSDSPAYTIEPAGDATVTITDNDEPVGLPEVTIEALDNFASEEGLNRGNFQITRTGDTTNPLPVNLIIGGTATNIIGYQGVSASPTIPAGSATIGFDITPIDDVDAEGPETVIITIASSAESYTIGAMNSDTVNIADNDELVVLPDVSIVANDNSAAEDGDQGQYTLSRTGSTDQPLVVHIATGGSATNGSDYQAINSPITIPASSFDVTIDLIPIDDNDVESSEVAQVTIQPDVTYNVVGSAFANINITDNDVEVEIAATDNSASEDGDLGQFTLTRTGPTDQQLVVHLAVSGSATIGLDYQATPEPQNDVFIPIGAASVTIDLTPIDDALHEGDEVAQLTLQPGLYTIASPGFANITIADNDVELPEVNVSANDPDASEDGDDGQFTVTRTGATDQPLVVSVSLQGDAINGVDYQQVANTVTIAQGASSATVDVVAIDDAEPEDTEPVTLFVVGTVNYELGANSNATVDITDNDGLPPEVNVAVTDATISEDGDTGQFTVTRSGPTDQPLVVNYSLAGGATNGDDYQQLPGTVTIAQGDASAVIDLIPVDDDDVEGIESFILDLLVNEAYTIGANGQALANIFDNDEVVLLLPEIAVFLDALEIDDGDDADRTDFGTVVQDAAELPTQTFTITNQGNADLTISSIVPPEGFVLSAAFMPQVVSPGNDLLFGVVFNSAGVTAVFQGDIVVTNDDADESTFEIPVTGSVTNVVSSNDFEDGQLPENGSVVEGDVTVIDDGTGNMVLGLTEGSDAAFSQNIDLPANVGELVFDVRSIVPSAGDRITVTIDGLVVFDEDANDFVSANLITVDAIDISDSAGQNVDIEIRLVSDDVGNAQIQVDNIVITTEDNVLLPFGGRTKATYSDANGDMVEVSLSGPGDGVVERPDELMADAAVIRLTQTTDRSTLTIRVRTRNGDTTIERIIVENANLRSIRARETDLARSIDAENGTINDIQMRDILAGATTITLGGDDNSRPGRYRFENIVSLDFTTTAQVRDFTALDWDSEPGITSQYSGTTLGSLNIRGQRNNPQKTGKMNANVTLTGVAGVRNTLKTARVADGADSAVWGITGNTGRIDFKGDINNWTLNVASDLAQVKAAVATNVNIDVGDGAARKLQFEQWDGGSFTGNSAADIKITGNRRDAAIPGKLKNVNFTLDEPFAPRAQAFKRITVNDLIEGVELRSNASGGTLRALGMQDSRFYLGAESEAQVGQFPAPGTAADFFNADVTELKSVRLQSFDNSILAAHKIKRTDLGDLFVDNATSTPFGLAANMIGRGSAVNLDSGAKFNFRNIDINQDFIDQFLAGGIDVALTDFSGELF